MSDGDPRRFGMIQVSKGGASGLFRLTIDGVLWASVEWSPRRGAWCIEDGIGQCLTHVEHIHGEDADADRAIRLAKKMIRNGTMPAPEEAHRRLRERADTMTEDKKLAEQMVLVPPHADRQRA